jgi:hypothetical protein
MPEEPFMRELVFSLPSSLALARKRCRSPVAEEDALERTGEKQLVLE